MGNEVSSSGGHDSSLSINQGGPTTSNDAPSKSEAPYRLQRGLKVVSAQYGDLGHPSRTADVTTAVVKLLQKNKPSLGRYMQFTLEKGSKNALFGEPARGHRKKLRMTFRIDGGREETYTIDEYTPFSISSRFYLNLSTASKLQETTYFDLDELQLLYEGFREAAWPEEQLRPESFISLYPEFDNELVVRSLFSSIDRDSNLSIDFAEFAVANSIMSRGSLEEKIKLSFSIMDLDGGGTVDRAEMIVVAREISSVMVKLGYEEESFGDAAHIVNLLFQRFPQGTLTGSNFAAGALRQSLLSDKKTRKELRMKKAKRKKKEKEKGASWPSFFGKKESETDNCDDDERGEMLEDDSCEVEEADEARLYLEQLTFEQFLERARNETDLVQCFGMFDFFYRKVVQPVEDQLDDAKEMEMSGWMSKDKGDSTLYQTLSLISTDRRWFVLRSGFLAYYKSENDEMPCNVINVCTGNIHLGPENSTWFFLQTPTFARHLFAPSPDESKLWAHVIRNNIKESLDNRFKSFAPIRDGITARWFINAREYFQTLMKVIPTATQSVYIADWYFAPGLHLLRSKTLDKACRVDNLLKSVAARGVKVYIMIWNAPQFAGFALESKFVTDYMNALHPNIHAIRHPTFTPITWSHHQKFVVVDEAIAFVGGVDLCYNRYDDERYLIVDSDKEFFPGRDYGNLNYAGEMNGKPLEEVIDRASLPRMPWHDIHMMVDGLAARDVAINFIQRWNHAIRGGCAAQLKSPVFLLPHSYVATEPKKRREKHASLPLSRHSIRASQRVPLVLPPAETEPPGSCSEAKDLLPKSAKAMPSEYDNCICQVVRSVSPWSAGTAEPEQSVYKAYLTLIKQAKHFIYIENQYFISSINRIRPKNRIAFALYKRLQRAISSHEKFRVIVVLPVYPAGDLSSVTTRYVIKYVYKTVSRQGNSILEKLQNEFPDTDVLDYISFYSLRNHGILGDRPITEQVYIHAKLMIVDDRRVIIGSANINDRSMRGTRDSEICIVVDEEQEDLLESTMGGGPFKVGRFGHSLRRRLWEDYLGLSKDDPMTETIADPVCDQSYRYWRARAQTNTQLYVRIFHYSLPDTIYTLADLKKFRDSEAQVWRQTEDDKRKLWIIKMQQDLKGVRGFLVEFPLLFMKDEQMSPTIFNYEYMVPRNVFL